jgi:hypothetical protein
MRRHLTHPDARLVHVGKAAPDALVAGRRSAGAAAGSGRWGDTPSWRFGHGTLPPVPDHRAVVAGHRRVRGWALLGFLTGHGTLGPFREQFFRAGHAHAGVLLVLSLAYFVYLGRAGYSASVQWLAGALLVGVLAQSGGFFVHLGLGQQGRSTPGTVLTRGGALLIAAALIILAIGLITHG